MPWLLSGPDRFFARRTVAGTPLDMSRGNHLAGRRAVTRATDATRRIDISQLEPGALVQRHDARRRLVDQDDGARVRTEPAHETDLVVPRETYWPLPKFLAPYLISLDIPYPAYVEPLTSRSLGFIACVNAATLTRSRWRFPCRNRCSFSR